MKAVLAYYSGIGTFVGPKSPGSAYVIMHHVMGEHAGAGGWGFIEGGMGAISNSIAAAGCAKGLEIRTDAEVASIDTNNGRATGVTLADGTRIEADTIASNVSAKLTFLKFLPRETLPAEFVRDLEGYRTYSTAFKINIACERLPAYASFDPEKCGFAYPTYTHIGPTIEYLERAYDDAKYGAWSRDPFITPVTPTFVDRTIAPPGKHVVNLFGGHAPYRLSEGDWATRKDEFVKNVLRVDGRARAGFLGRHHRHAGADAAGYRGQDRLAARPYLSRRVAGRSAVLCAPRSALGGLPKPDQGALSMRRVGPSGRRRRRGGGPQCRARDPQGLAQMRRLGTIALLLPASMLLFFIFVLPLLRLFRLSLSAEAGPLSSYAQLLGDEVYFACLSSTRS